MRNHSLALLLIIVCGCGPVLLHPHGRVTHNGGELKGKKGERLIVIFHKLDEKGEELDSFIGKRRPNEGFEVSGHHGKGIPPGKYRISVQITDKKGNNDRLKGAYGPEDSPFVQELQDDSDEIVLDLTDVPE